MDTYPDKEIQALEAFLYDLRNRGSKYSLERMRAFARTYGNPQDSLKSLHVAGSNGKGSVSAMLEAIFLEHKFTVGLYTSPHLVYLGERMRVNQKNISKPKLLELLADISKSADEIFADKQLCDKPSFFEYMTMAAFKYFADSNVDYAIFECGLGGALDATNILRNPLCSIITSISLDHTDLLGNTIPEIALQKAGIIKENSLLICGIMPQEARCVIEKEAKQKNAKSFFLEDFFKDTDSMPQSNLEGEYQRKNAALALLAIRKMNEFCGLNLDENLAIWALKKVMWFARWQKIALKKSFMILDSSHNLEGAHELEKNLAALRKTYPDKKLCVSFGSLEIGRAKALFSVIEKYASKIFLLEVNNPRSLKIDELLSLKTNANVELVPTSVEALFPELASANISDDEILVSTGSIYLAGEILARLDGFASDNLHDKI